MEEPYTLTEDRYHHASWSLSTGDVMLLGGTGSVDTTDLITPGVSTRRGFNLAQSTKYELRGI